jgi:hypothetical protein
MKQLKTRSKSKHAAGQQERPKQVDKRDESMCKNETKASGKPNQKTREVEDLRNPETKAAESLPKFISLPNYDGNQQLICVSVADGTTNFKRADDNVKKMHRTDKQKAHLDAVYRDTLRN